MRRIIVDEKAAVELGLFHGEVGPGMLELLREGNEPVAGDGGEVFAQVGGEIQGDPLGQIGVLPAEVVDAHHGIIDEVRPHLQDRDAGALIGDLPFLAQNLCPLIIQDDQKHREGADGDGDGKEVECRVDKMDQQGQGDREKADKKGSNVPSGQSEAPADHTGQIQKHDGSRRKKQQGIQGTAAETVLRRGIVKPGREGGDIQQDEAKAPQRGRKAESGAVQPVLPAAAEDISRQHGQQKRAEQRLKIIDDGLRRSHIRTSVGKRVSRAETDIKHENSKIGDEKALVPPVGSGHGDRNDKPKQRQHDRGAQHDQEDLRGQLQLGHLSAPPEGKG